MKNFRKSYKKKRLKPLFYNRYLRLAVVVLLLVGGAFYLINFHSFFQVREINISGNVKVPMENIRDAVTAEVEKKVLFFPSKSILLVDFSKIKKQVLDDFPQVARVEINRRLPHTLNIIVAEKSAAAVWRQNNRDYLLDENGIIFEEAGEGELLKIESLIANEEPVLGSSVIARERLAQLLEIEKTLTEAEVLLVQAVIVSPERLDIKTVEGWEIYFNLQEDIGWQLTELAALLEKRILSENRENLEYIDLRFEKVYYKFLNDK